MLHKIKIGLKSSFTFLCRYRGEILYYAAVLLVLGAIAWGAEQYRIRREQPIAQAPVVSAAEIVQAGAAEATFELPEGLTPVQDFSPVPIWNENDSSWQAHPAVDYACAEGQVCALADGIVQTVGVSGVLGGFAEVQSGEVLLKYCCIAPEEHLQPGASIQKGEIIGTAQNAMPGEMHLGSHLHLEVSRGGETVNPRDLLQEND